MRAGGGVLGVALAIAPTPTPIPTPARPGDAGYWLSAELLGPAAARTRALAQLGSSIDDAAPSPPVGLSGEAVAHVPDIASALRWVETHAFGEAPPAGDVDALALRLEAAAVPGGTLLTEHGVQLRALAITGQTQLGEHRAVDWPADPKSILPPDSTWIVADLVPAAAPIFGAPAPAIPPAAERFATIHRRGEVFVVRMLDRCDDARRCLRWAQVVARDEDRFVPGYLPAFQVAPREQWVHAEAVDVHAPAGLVGLPRAILLRSGVDGSQARFVLHARDRNDTVHRTTVTAAMHGDAFPNASISVAADLATVILGDAPAQTFALDPTLDARPLTPHPTEAAADPRGADAPSPARSAGR
jgi:hypothetical protein